METNETDKSVEQLNLLKKDAQRFMKKGLPFILASVAIWLLILLARLLARPSGIPP